MPRTSPLHQFVAVHLSTAKGVVFDGTVEGLTLLTNAGTFEIAAQGANYATLPGRSDLTIRIGALNRIFQLENANACIKPRRFTVLAQSIRELITGPI